MILRPPKPPLVLGSKKTLSSLVQSKLWSKHWGSNLTIAWQGKGHIHATLRVLMQPRWIGISQGWTLSCGSKSTVRPADKLCVSQSDYHWDKARYCSRLCLANELRVTVFVWQDQIFSMIHSDRLTFAHAPGHVFAFLFVLCGCFHVCAQAGFSRPCVRKFGSHPSLPFCLLDMWGGGCHALHHVSSRRSLYLWA